MRVLVVKTSSMGDLVHTLPALTDASKAIGEIRFDWICEPAFADIPHWHPAIRDVFQIPLRMWKGKIHHLLLSNELANYKKKLSGDRYDAIIDAQGLLKSAYFVTRFTRGPKHGFDWHSSRESFASVAYDFRHRIDRSNHAISRIRELFAKSLGYPIPDSFPDASIDLMRSTEKTDRLVLITRASRQAKCWQSVDWRRVIECALPQFSEVVLPAGSDAEFEAVASMCKGLPVRILNQLPLKDVAFEISGARAAVSVDTGLAHVADALGTPILALYGPTKPGLVGPVGERSRTIKSLSGKMSDISVDKVMHWVSQTDTEFAESGRG